MILESFGAKIVAGALASSAVVGGGYAVSQQQCPTGMESTIFGCAKVTSYSNTQTKVYLNPGQGRPKPGTGGLILRDDEGNDTGSGIGEDQIFDILECGPKGSGLVLVNQTTRGHGGGWGTQYGGMVKWKYVETHDKKFDCKF